MCVCVCVCVCVQVPRILNPVVKVLDELPRLARDRNIAEYIDRAFGGVEECE